MSLSHPPSRLRIFYLIVAATLLCSCEPAMQAKVEGGNPAQRIIRRFGGQSALAALLGKRQSTIEHWANTGRVPAQWHGPLMSLARQK